LSTPGQTAVELNEENTYNNCCALHGRRPGVDLRFYELGRLVCFVEAWHKLAKSSALQDIFVLRVSAWPAGNFWGRGSRRCVCRNIMKLVKAAYLVLACHYCPDASGSPRQNMTFKLRDNAGCGGEPGEDPGLSQLSSKFLTLYKMALACPQQFEIRL
jgi:hypothetical protein